MVVVGYAWSRTAKVAAFSGEKCIHFGRLLLCFTFLCIAMGSSAPCPPRYRNIIPLRHNADKQTSRTKLQTAALRGTQRDTNLKR